MVLRITSPNGSTEQAAIPPDGLLLGRDPGSNIFLEGAEVSWHHARIWREDKACFVCDLDSVNGTRVNGSPAPPAMSVSIDLDDEIRIAGYVLYCAAGAQCVAETIGLDVHHVSERERIVIGRGPDCDIVLDDPAASWRHSIVSRDGDGWRVEDLGSANGTFVNERRITTARLEPADRLIIGSHRFTLGDSDFLRTSDESQIRLDTDRVTQVISRSGSEITLLRDVTVSACPRELVAIVGASGAGKTTLLLALSGYNQPTAGRVLLNGIDMYAHLDVFRSAIGYVPHADIVHLDVSIRREGRGSRKGR